MHSVFTVRREKSSTISCIFILSIDLKLSILEYIVIRVLWSRSTCRITRTL